MITISTYRNTYIFRFMLLFLYHDQGNFAITMNIDLVNIIDHILVLESLFIPTSLFFNFEV